MKKKENTKEMLFEMMGKLDKSFKPKLNEELAVASDGGYYDKPEHRLMVSPREAEFINRQADELFNDLFTDINDGNATVDRDEEIKYNIARSLQSQGLLDHDVDGGETYYWLIDPSKMELAKQEFQALKDNLYDGIDKNKQDDDSNFQTEPKRKTSRNRGDYTGEETPDDLYYYNN